MRNRKTARKVFVVASAAVLVITTGITPVLAVHDETFQLDGDASASTTTNVGGTTQSVDWDTLFVGDAGTTANPLPAGFDAADLKRDFTVNPNGSFNTSDGSTFATGSKDILPISAWQCNIDNNVNSKIDVMNAYAASYTVPAGELNAGDEILYFGLERNKNTGDANVAFWFLQDDNVGCTSAGGAVTFTGGHVDGDLLIVSAFSNGGTVSTVDVYEWVGDDATGFLDPEPVFAGGVDCRSGSLGTNDIACAAANTVDNGDNGTIETEWLTANFNDGVGHLLRRSEFFEGGLNLTAADLGGKCFNSFLGDTRSSTSLTATLFDFAGGTLGQCTSTTVTTPNISTAQIPADPNPSSVTVNDSAAITVTGADDWSGDVVFHLCGPMALNSSDLCTTGGVEVSTEVASDETPTVTSDNATVTSVGRYCWRADFAGDSDVGVPSSSDARANECFTITPRQSALVTQAGAGPVDFGNPVTDTATLSNTAHQPGTGGPAGSTDGSINPATPGGDADGTITFTLFKADCTTLATGTGTNPQTVAVTGDGTYGPVSFTPDAPGTYHWVASYDGDAPNTLGTSHNTICNDPNESVIVRQIPTEIKTRQSWLPNDTATISSTVGNLAGGGTVVFSLHAGATCDGAAFYSQSFNVVGGAATETFTTTNITVPITTLFTDGAGSTTGQYSWKVVYTPAAGDTAHTGKQSACAAENFNITYKNDAGPGTNLP